MDQQALIIFIKNPELGKVKTRIAVDLGDKEALRIYRLLLQYTQDICLRVRATRYLYYSKFIDRYDHWSVSDFNKKLQSGRDLGERMANAFTEVFIHSNKAVIIGSDCYQIDEKVIHSSFEKLDQFNIVIGPAKDGGYYLIGMDSYYPSLFQNINWSTSEVLKQTLDKAHKLQLTYYLLEELSDVDTVAEWELIKNNFDS